MNKLNFSKFNNVLCDSLEALNWAYANGLNKKAIIRTSSPSLLFNNKINTSDITSKWSFESLKSFKEGINDFGKKIFSEILILEPENKESALLIAQTAVNFHKIIYKAACLNNYDLKDKILILNVKGNFGKKNLNINSPWAELLDSNKNSKLEFYAANNTKEIVYRNKISSLFPRLRLGGVETLFYRIIIKFLSKFLSKIFNKQALIMGENELIIETMFHMSLKGVALQKLETNDFFIPKKKNNIIQKPNINFDKIKLTLYPLLRERFEKWLDKDFVEPCINMFFKDLNKQLLDLEYYKNILNAEIIRYRNKNNILITSNHISSKVLATFSVCKKFKIPIISFQHGVTPEICDDTKEIAVSHPANNVNKFITFNKVSAYYAANEAYIKSDSYISGLPNRYFRSKKNNIDSNNILFLSMHLYRGNIGSIKCNYTDHSMAIEELSIIESILNKLPHKVHYKTYPEENLRYPDKDPVLQTVPNYENIILINDKIDARYLLEKYRVIITTHASSTISWVIMSKKPIIFINDKNNSSLSKEAMISFRKGLFVFNKDELNFNKNILNFLSQSIEKIEELYLEKEQDRQALIDSFISSHDKGAGERTAKMLYKEYF